MHYQTKLVLWDIAVFAICASIFLAIVFLVVSCRKEDSPPAPVTGSAMELRFEPEEEELQPPVVEIPEGTGRVLRTPDLEPDRGAGKQAPPGPLDHQL